jgi:hypothetical protein
MANEDARQMRLPGIDNIPDDPNVARWITNVMQGSPAAEALKIYKKLHPGLAFNLGPPNDAKHLQTEWFFSGWSGSFVTHTLKELQDLGIVGIYARKQKDG